MPPGPRPVVPNTLVSPKVRVPSEVGVRPKLEKSPDTAHRFVVIYGEAGGGDRAAYERGQGKSK